MFENKKMLQIMLYGLIGLIIILIIILILGLTNFNPCSGINCNLYSIFLVYCFSLIVSILILIIYRNGKIEENIKAHENKIKEITINDFLKKIDWNSKESEEAVKRFSTFCNNIRVFQNRDIAKSLDQEIKPAE
jgi:hypothetical protein